MDRMSFGIHHYAGKVMYDADQFVTRNQDTLPTDLQDLCMKSDNFIIASDPDAETARAAAEASGGGRSAPKRQKSNIVAPTVWGKYKTQLQSLMTNLRKTNSRYIRCIKPNMVKKPVLMEHLPTVEQLRCAGVVAAVTLSRSAFPNRLDSQVVRYRYASMWDPNAYPAKITSSMTPEEALRANVDAILNCALKSKEERTDGKVIRAYVVGKTKAYFRAGALEYLEANRLESGLDAPAAKIQAAARGWLVRKNWDKMTNDAREEERKRKEEEERKALELRRAKEAAARKKAEEQARKIREEKAARERAERELREKQERAEQKRREREERERLQREEDEEKERIHALKKEIKALEKQLEDKKADNARKIRDAEEDLADVQKEKQELKEKYDEICAQAAKVDKKDIAANAKKIEESEKIVAYLRKENKKVRDQTDKMKDDLEDLKEQNHRLIEANASAGASLDSLEKQKKNLSSHNSKLEENLKKWVDQNRQLKADLENRTAYYNAETKIRAEYERAMEKIVELLEQRCNDSKLIEDVTTAQLQCEALAARRTGIPGLSGSEVSDF
jgi:myosin heavy subunit